MKTNITHEHPTKEQIKEARQEAGLTQIQAAEIALLGNSVRRSEYENGKENMDPARFELFMIKTGQHPEFIRRKTPGRKPADAKRDVAYT
jgi:transcriptional regulator with XRE-family HTH domain